MAAHRGYVFSNAWVHQTVESMCIALMVDPQGDPEIIKAQEKMKATLEDWIPKILAAQEPDGYLQTAFHAGHGRDRWPGSTGDPGPAASTKGTSPATSSKSAINHYTLTEGQDKRLYNAAKKLADCWGANIGPARRNGTTAIRRWSMALVRFGRFVNDMEGPGKGDSYIELAKFLLDCRKGRQRIRPEPRAGRAAI